jgi:hypothetical protein
MESVAWPPGGSPGHLQSVGLPRIDTVLAIAGKDEASGDVIIKALNTAPEKASVKFNISSAGDLNATGTLIQINFAEANRRKLIR